MGVDLSEIGRLMKVSNTNSLSVRCAGACGSTLGVVPVRSAL